MAEATSPPALPAAAGATKVADESPLKSATNAASDPQLAAGGRYNEQLSNAFKILQEMTTPKSKCNWKLSSSKKVISAPVGTVYFLCIQTIL